MQDAFQDAGFCSAPESKVFASLAVAQCAMPRLVLRVCYWQYGGAYVILQWSIADLEQLLEDLSGLKQSAGGDPLAASPSPLQRASYSPTAASLSKLASEKLDHVCSELGRPLPAVAAMGCTSAAAGEEMLGRRRSAQVAESTFPRRVS